MTTSTNHVPPRKSNSPVTYFASWGKIDKSTNSLVGHGRPVWKRINVLDPREVNGLNVMRCGRSRSEKSWTMPSLMAGSGLNRTDNFHKFYGSRLDRIHFFRIRIGLGLKIFTVCTSQVSTDQGRIRIQHVRNRKGPAQKINVSTPLFITNIAEYRRWAWTGSGLDILQDTCDFFGSGLDLDIRFEKKVDQDRIRILVWFP